MNARQPGAAEDLTGAVRSLVAQALSLCAQANTGELELVEMLLRDARDVLDDPCGGMPVLIEYNPDNRRSTYR